MWNLPIGVEIALSFFGAETPLRWINVKSGEEMDARAFDWDTLTPIILGQERQVKIKEFVLHFIGEAFLHPLFKSQGWKGLAAYVESKTGIAITAEELEGKIKTLVESGAKRIVITTKAGTLGRKACPDNSLIFKLESFGSTSLDYENGFNKRIMEKQGEWIIKTPNLWVTKVRPH